MSGTWTKWHQPSMRLLIIFGAGIGLLITGGCSPVSAADGTFAPCLPISRNQSPPADAPPASLTKELVARVLGDTEDMWDCIFRVWGKGRYPEPRVVLFSGQAISACGAFEAAIGPIYCPVDQRIYIDPAFLRELSKRIGAAGDFAQGNLIAHEVGHHVQNVLGTMQKVNTAMRGTVDEQRRNQLRVRLELQADCYAGVWTHFVRRRGTLKAGDLENGVLAALGVGHASGLGDTAQRARWFKQGLSTGDPRECDTFRELLN